MLTNPETWQNQLQLSKQIPMKIALIGYGKMCRAIEEIALENLNVTELAFILDELELNNINIKQLFG